MNIRRNLILPSALCLLAFGGCGDDAVSGGTSSTGNTVAARVLRPDGTSAASDTVLLRRDTAASIRPLRKFADADGRVVFHDIPAGDWVIEARSANTGRLIRFGLDDRGERSIDLRTGAYASVSGQLLEPGGIPRVEVDLVGTDFRTQADPQGRFRFERVSPGTHRVEALPRPDGSLGVARWEDITVAERDTIELEARAPLRTRDAGWVLAWSEEFDRLDTARWNFDTGTGCPALCGWGNGSWQRFDMSQAEAREGLLALRAESFFGFWKSASIHTKGRVEFQYGRIEVRARMPAVTGAWSLVALFGDSASGPVWPAAGAIDIAGLWGYRSDHLMGIGHRTDGAGFPIHLGGALLSPEGWGDRWATFTVEWSPQEIVWLADDQVFHRIDGGSPFDHPFYLSLRLMVGGDGNVLPAPMQAPFELLVDHIRLYRRTP